MQISSDTQFQYTCNHNQFETYSYVTILFISDYPVRHETTDRRLASVAEWSRALDKLSRCAGVTLKSDSVEK